MANEKDSGAKNYLLAIGIFVTVISLFMAAVVNYRDYQAYQIIKKEKIK